MRAVAEFLNFGLSQSPNHPIMPPCSKLSRRSLQEGWQAVPAVPAGLHAKRPPVQHRASLSRQRSQENFGLGFRPWRSPNGADRGAYFVQQSRIK
jgi:hypothetical protein